MSAALKNARGGLPRRPNDLRPYHPETQALLLWADREIGPGAFAYEGETAFIDARVLDRVARRPCRPPCWRSLHDAAAAPAHACAQSRGVGSHRRSRSLPYVEDMWKPPTLCGRFVDENPAFGRLCRRYRHLPGCLAPRYRRRYL